MYLQHQPGRNTAFTRSPTPPSLRYVARTLWLKDDALVAHYVDAHGIKTGGAEADAHTSGLRFHTNSFRATAEPRSVPWPPLELVDRYKQAAEVPPRADSAAQARRWAWAVGATC